MLVPALLATLAAAGAHGASPRFTTIDNPADPTFNQALGINNAGVVAGYYGSGAVGHPNQAYTIAAPYTTFVAANYPGSVQSRATGINDSGACVGFFASTNNGNDAFTGYSERTIHNKPTYRTYSLSDASPTDTQLLDITDKFMAVGFYTDAQGINHCADLSTVSTVSYAVTIKGSVSTVCTAATLTRILAGTIVTKAGLTEGFLRMNGKFIYVTYPGSTNTQILGVNDNGLAVGFYRDSKSLPHGIVFNSADDKLTVINAPLGVQGTTLNAVNNANQAVGSYTDAAGNTHGLLVGGIVAP